MGVVFNRLRNGVISRYVAEQASEGKTSLVFVKMIEHANILLETISGKGVPVALVTGSISGPEREKIKISLEQKKIKCVIATAAWREGVDVPSLDIVINAAGYLSEKASLQMAGRVLRIYEGKTEGTIVDFLDAGKYLANHCVHRLLTYKELGWL